MTFTHSIFWNSISFNEKSILHCAPLTKRGVMRQNESLQGNKVYLSFSWRAARAAVHAPLAETFRKFEERLERSGRGTKRADTTGPRLPAEVIVFSAARERTYSASKYTPRGWLTYSVLTGQRINTMGLGLLLTFSASRFLDMVRLKLFP